MAADDEVLFVNFNQDASSLSVGTRKGYRLYSLAAPEDLQRIHESEMEDICRVERLFSSSLVTLVSLTAPRKLRVCHFMKGTEICSQSFSNTILSVRLNRLRVVVCLEENLYIHNIRDMKVLHTIRDTPPNPHGLCELTQADISYLAYPGSSQIGEVQIFDAANLQAVSMIPAHDGPLAALKFNADGTKIATASEKGTVIRVFAVPSGEKMFEFRRGVKRCVTIYSLAFSADSLYLCSSSNTETIHIFKLEDQHDKEKQGGATEEDWGGSGEGMAGWYGYVSKTAASYLPAQMTDIFQQDRSFATAKLPRSGAKNVVALPLMKQVLRLLVASLDGYLYVYNVDRNEGGECALLKQHKFGGESGRNEASQDSGGNRSYATAVESSPAEKKQLDSAVSNSQGAQGAAADLAGLKLDDSKEFPPMSHTAESEWD